MIFNAGREEHWRTSTYANGYIEANSIVMHRWVYGSNQSDGVCGCRPDQVIGFPAAGNADGADWLAEGSGHIAIHLIGCSRFTGFSLAGLSTSS